MKQAAADLADAIRFRSTHGLRADVAYVKAAAADRTRFSNAEFGLPLTAREAKEIHRRIDLQLSLGPAKRLASTLANYAGVYIDQANGAQPVFLFSGDPKAHDRAIAAMVPPGVEFRLEKVQRSYADLKALKADVRSNLVRLFGLGIDVRTVGINSPSNTVVVGISDVTARATSALHGLFGDAITIKHVEAIGHDACNSMSDCWPNKGGIRINAVGFSSCTSGFMMKRTSPTPNRYAMLTAGHCIGLNGGAGVDWRHGPTGNTHFVGDAGVHTWYNGEYADAGVIWVDSPPTNKNIFLADDNPLIQQQLSYATPTSEQTPGDTACRMGYNSTLKCGNIVDQDVDLVNVDGRTINNLIEVDFDSHVGDSGGPIFTGGAGLGTHSDSANPDCAGCHGWYTPMKNSLDSLFIRHNIVFKFCLNLTCSVVSP